MEKNGKLLNYTNPLSLQNFKAAILANFHRHVRSEDSPWMIDPFWLWFIPPIFGNLGDGLLLFQPHYFIYIYILLYNDV